MRGSVVAIASPKTAHTPRADAHANDTHNAILRRDKAMDPSAHGASDEAARLSHARNRGTSPLRAGSSRRRFRA